MSMDFVFRLIGMTILAIVGAYTGIEFGQFNEGLTLTYEIGRASCRERV